MKKVIIIIIVLFILLVVLFFFKKSNFSFEETVVPDITKGTLLNPFYNRFKNRFEKGNFEGSFTNHILCVHENEILNHLIKYFTDNNFKIFALRFSTSSALINL